MQRPFLRRSCQRRNSARSQYVDDLVDSSRRRDRLSDPRAKCHPVSGKQSRSHRQTGTPIEHASNHNPPVLRRRTRSGKDPHLSASGSQGTNVLCASRLDCRPTWRQGHSLRSRPMHQYHCKRYFGHPHGRSHRCHRAAPSFLASRFSNRPTQPDLCDETRIRHRTLVTPNVGQDAAVGRPFVYRTSRACGRDAVRGSSGRRSVGAGRLFQRVGNGVTRSGRRIGSSCCSHCQSLVDGSLARYGCPRSDKTAPNGRQFGHSNVPHGIAFCLSLDHPYCHRLLSRCSPYRVRRHPVGPFMSNDGSRRSCSVSRSRRAAPGSCRANVANHSRFCSSKSNGQST